MGSPCSLPMPTASTLAPISFSASTPARDVAAEVFSVGEEDHHPVLRAAVGVVEHLARQHQRVADVGAALGHRVGVDRAQEHLRRVVVGGERALDEGVAGEGDDRHPVALELVEQRGQLELGALDAARARRRGRTSTSTRRAPPPRRCRGAWSARRGSPHCGWARAKPKQQQRQGVEARLHRGQHRRDARRERVDEPVGDRALEPAAAQQREGEREAAGRQRQQQVARK